EKITMPQISNIVSAYASIPEVRKILVKLQRDMSEKYSVIMDGRDIGTVVLKNADFKFFLTSSGDILFSSAFSATALYIAPVF
ncbi:Cytidylate kinase, partial [human gut metagenome]